MLKAKTLKAKTAPDIKACKGQHNIVVLTAYDYTMARLVDDHVDILLVGDSLACVVQGQNNTLSVTLDEMIYHSKMVARAAQQALVVGDLPFGSYQTGSDDALRSAIRLMKEACVGAVKLEGGEIVCDSIQAMAQVGIPVLAHLGLTPQSYFAVGGNKVQCTSEAAANQLLNEAKMVQQAGAFALILEAIPAPLAQRVTQHIDIPTIGIGAGPYCDGQVLVINDMLGLNTESVPMKFNKEYCTVRDVIHEAVACFAQEVRSGVFPDSHYSYGISKKVSYIGQADNT